MGWPVDRMETLQTVCSTDQMMTSKEILTTALWDAKVGSRDPADAFNILYRAVNRVLSQIDTEMDDQFSQGREDAEDKIRDEGYRDGLEDGWYDGRADCAEE